MMYVKYYDSKKGIYAHTVRRNAGGVRRGNLRQFNHSVSHVVHRLPTHDTKLHIQSHPEQLIKDGMN